MAIIVTMGRDRDVEVKNRTLPVIGQGVNGEGAVIAPRLSALLLLLLLADCGWDKGLHSTSEPQSQLKLHVTTTGDVYGRIGAPPVRNLSPNGDETWVYVYSKPDINPASFLAGIGFSGTTVSEAPYDSQTLTLQFRKQVLVSCKVHLVQGKAVAMTGVSGRSQEVTVEKSCA
jgi:hypothetical protein